jgi:hypothetical protein
VGVLYIYKFEYLADIEKKEAAIRQREAKKIVSIDPDEVSKIEITQYGSTLQVVRKDGLWKITRPVRAVANQSAVMNLVSSMSTLMAEEIFGDEGENLADYGLSPAVVKLVFYLEKEGGVTTTQSVLVGNTSPVGGKVYGISSKIGKVFSASMGYKTALSKSLFQLREKRIFPDQSGEINKVRIRIGKKATVLKKDKDGEWKITSPISVRADRVIVEDYIDRIQRSQASEFIDKRVDEKAIGLTPSVMSVAFHYTDGEKELLYIGKKDTNGKGVAVRRKKFGSIALLPSDFFDGMPSVSDDFRDTHFFPIQRDEVLRINWQKGSDSAELKKSKKSGRWRVVSMPEERLDQGRILAYLIGLEGVKVEKFIKSLPTGEDENLINLKVNELNFSRTLRLYRIRGKVYGTSSFQPDPFIISDDVSKKIVSKLDKLFDRRIFPVLQAEVKKISVARNGKTYRLEKDGRDWVLTKPRKKKVDVRSAGSFLATIVNAEYTKKARVEKRSGKTDPVASISIWGDAKEKKYGLTIYIDNEHGTLIKARHKGDKNYLYIPKVFLEKISIERLERLAR